jgi:hypothetical protein
MHAFIYTYLNTYKYVPFVHMHIHIHTHIHTYIHAHTHTNIRAHSGCECESAVLERTSFYFGKGIVASGFELTINATAAVVITFPISYIGRVGRLKCKLQRSDGDASRRAKYYYSGVASTQIQTQIQNQTALSPRNNKTSLMISASTEAGASTHKYTNKEVHMDAHGDYYTNDEWSDLRQTEESISFPVVVRIDSTVTVLPMVLPSAGAHLCMNACLHVRVYM